ncbi:TAXI family TRAP transporter solute-binding subunit [Chloroflexota bacterium]
MKKGFIAMTVLLVIGLILAACSQPAPEPAPAPAPMPEEITQIRLLGAPVGSSTFMMRALWADYLHKKLGMPSGAFPGGERENLQILNRGDAEESYSSAWAASNAYQGLSPFSEPLTNIRFMNHYTTVQLTFAVRADSDLKSIDDIVGKKMAIGSKGSMAEGWPLFALEEGYGITPKTIEDAGGVVSHLSYSEMGTQLSDQTVDVITLFTKHDVVASHHKATEERFGIRLLPLSEEAMDKILAKYPFVVKGSMTGGTYKNEPNNVNTIGSATICLTHRDMPADLVYKIMDVILSDEVTAEADKRYPIMMMSQKDAWLRGSESGVPLHPGALKWYQDNGIAIPSGITAKD